jgi:hypothetical protein
MLKPQSKIAAVISLALTPWTAHQGLAENAQAFDGSWNVELECPDTDDAKGYTWRFPVQVSSGELKGSYHSPTDEATGELTGKVGSDGHSVVTLVGKTAPESAASGLSGPGTTIHYHVDVQFFEHSGFGKRSGKRACTLTFIKM